MSIVAIYLVFQALVAVVFVVHNVVEAVKWWRHRDDPDDLLDPEIEN